ncbi:hypothetical protein L2E82_45564 [Cichorium intybus]|uniref:Uncharacterized protein n=1 Tax=Cichorium intybus TaxID=13427 RepID=A0ACB8ZUN3_CICIN|nr:hypothetical protein L2E82_45564 [Cichorium intybus]
MPRSISVLDNYSINTEEEPQKEQVAQSKPKKLKSVNISREPRLASPFPQNPKKTDPTAKKGANEIPDTHCNVKYERRTKYQAELRGCRVVKHKQRMITEELELPKKRSINDDTTNKDVPQKVRRVQPRRSSITPTVPISKPAVEKQERKKTKLLYLEGLRFDGVNVEGGRPSICCWNASTMRLREELEKTSGGFGMGVIQDIVGREETQEI